MYTHMYTHTYMCVCMCTYCVHMYTHTQTHTHTHTHTQHELVVGRARSATAAENRMNGASIRLLIEAGSGRSLKHLVLRSADLTPGLSVQDLLRCLITRPILLVD